ncbi:MAG: hypothetical protein JO165_01945, partial [Candidatus Eremiobacteraeota bacterium]|nr:hypothetical protein [Candidatus Eremiobacteraeota bacterium]
MKRARFIVRFGTFATALTLCPHIAAAATYSAQTTYDLGNQGALYVINFEARLGNVRCWAAVLPRNSFHARIVQGFDSQTSATPFDAVARRYNAQIAINGGRFNGAFAPDGLLIVDGKTVGEKRSDWDGVLQIDRAGRAGVTTTPQLHEAQYA